MIQKTILTLAFLLLIALNAGAGMLRDVSESACRVIAGNQCGSGTAVYEDESNIYVLTNAHVVSNYPQATVEFWKYGKKVPKPIVGSVVWKKDDYNRGIDFAIIQVSKSRFISLPRVIYFLPNEHSLTEPGTYIATAGCPRSQWLSIKEGYMVRRDGHEIKFRPVAEDGQSGSGLFTSINGQTYIAGVVTARTGRGEILRNQDGFDITLGVALNINNVRLALRNGVNYSLASDVFLVNEILYARDTSGRYWKQNSDGSVSVPPGTQIAQWGYSGPTCPPTTQPPMTLPPGSQLQPLPGPILPNQQPQQPQQPQSPQNGGYGTIPPGFGDPPTEAPIIEEDAEPEEVLPPDEDAEPEIPPQVTELQIKIEALLELKVQLESDLENQQEKVDELQAKIIELQTQIEQLQNSNSDISTELSNKVEQISVLETQLLETQTTIEDLSNQIELKNKQIEEYKNTIEDLFITIEPPTQEDQIQPQPSIWSKAWNTIKSNPWWMLLLGVGGTLLLGKTSLLPKAWNGIKKLFTFGQNVHTVVQNNPEIDDKLRSILREYFNKTESKLDATNDYVSSRFNEIDSKINSFSNQDRNENVINNTINVEKDDDDDVIGSGSDYGKYPANNLDRIKQFFELKKRDGESIEQWAFYALLYKEAMQLLRQGKFSVSVVSGKVTLQGQRIAADKIDEWVRDQYIKRTSIEKLSLDYIYHEAMLGFLYKEAVNLLRRGHFPILGSAETADAIENWVKREFLVRMGIVL